MSRTRTSVLPLLLALAAPGAPAALIGAGLLAPATAQASVFSEPVVALLHQGEVVGDGQSETTLEILALEADGTPASGMSGRVSASSGDVGRLTELAPGRYQLTWTPPAVDEVRDVTFNMKLKLPSAGGISRSATVSVRPDASFGVSANANPARVVLGQDSSATVRINLTGGATGAREGADLAVATSSGTVANVTPLGGGEYSLMFTAPDKLFPHLALITISDRRAPEETFGAFALPLVGKASFPVQGQPDASLLVRVGDREFGPVQANAQGKATMPLTVPPGVRQATVISIKDGKRTEETLDLKVPATQRVELLPTVTQLPADGSREATLRVFVAQPDGSPDGSADVTFSSTAGTVGAAKHQGGGIYAATWTPPRSGAALTATVSVTVADEAGPQSDKLEVKLLPALPDAMSLEVAPSTLPAQGGKVVVTARVSENSGARGVVLGATGAQPSANATRNSDGAWTTPFQTPGDSQVHIQGAVAAPPSERPLARVLLFPSADRIRPDGVSEAVLTVLTLDADGYPVPAAPVALEVTEGDAMVGGSVTTNDNGIAHLKLTAGKTAGLVRIQGASGGHVGAGVLIQAPDSVDVPAIALGGDARTVTARTAWDARVNSVVVPRPGSAVLAAGTPAATDTQATALAGPVTAVTVTPQPAQVAPGQEISLIVEAKDAKGVGATGQQLQIYPSAGTVGGIGDKGGGLYQAQLTAPASGTELIRVTVVHPKSGISQMLEVPVSSDTGPAWGVADSTGTASAPPDESEVREAPAMPAPEPEVREVAPPKEKKEKVARSPGEGDHPWLQVQAGFLGGFYSYQQEPQAVDGPLYGDRIAFGGGETPAAGAAGLALRGRAWSPGMEYFGAEVGFRSTSYRVELSEFGSVVPDWLNDVDALLLARYPVDVDRTRLHAGARLGLGINDFMLYRQDLTGDNPVLDYGPLIVPSFDAGLELGADYDGVLFGEFTGTAGFNGGGGLYSVDVDGRIGWAFVDSLYAYANVGWMTRNTGVFVEEGGDRLSVGDLSDAFTMIGAGIGWQQ